jgi:hypothetical protein
VDALLRRPRGLRRRRFRPEGVILPDPKITPGVLNPKVLQSTIKTTICKSGWTKTIRPPVSYTNALKIKQMPLYGEGGSPSNYEEDHFIPLELGGAPRTRRTFGPNHTRSRSCPTRSRTNSSGRFAKAL